MKNSPPQLPSRPLQRDLEEIRKAYDLSLGFFGVALDSEAPIIVCDCIEFLRHKGLKREGIFRVNGNEEKVSEIREMYNAEFKTRKSKQTNTISVLNALSPLPSPIDVASLLKRFFSSLSSPMIESAILKKMYAVARSGLAAEQETREMSRLFTQISTPKRECLSFLLSFLKEICKYESENSMNATNLGICFGLVLTQMENEVQTSKTDQMIFETVEGILVVQRLIALDITLYMPDKDIVAANTRY